MIRSFLRAASFRALTLLPLMVPGVAAAELPGSDGAGLDLAPDTPEVLATLASDGRYTIRLVPQGPWSQAELTVSGDGSHELSAVDGASPVLVEGVRDGLGPIGLHLAVVTPDDRGVSWSFTVEPELLPVQAPVVEPDDDKRKKRRRRRDR